MPGNPPPLPPAPNCKETFAQLDANHDGFITLDEFQRVAPAPQPLPVLNGTASPAQGMLSGTAGPILGATTAAVLPAPPTADAFRKMDVNGDGRVDPGEFCAMSEGAPPLQPASDCKTEFAALDANHDGKVTWDEFYLGVQPTMNVPADADVKAKLNATFQAGDSNHDGALDPGELCAMPAFPVAPPAPVKAAN
jgi:Ca2+-binding EF-hand superfamily protein